MKAMVLAAGKGSRLYPQTEKSPKPMMKIGKKPLLEHVIINLKNQKIDDIVINLHHLPEVVTSYFGDGSDLGINIKYSFEKNLLGTAGAVRKMKDDFQKTFAVVYGDNFWNFDLAPIDRFHKKNNSMATIACHRPNRQITGGVVKIDKDDKVIGLVERPKPKEIDSPWENAGLYILEPEILDLIPENEFYDFARDVFPKMIDDRKDLYAFRSSAKVQGINTFEDYRKAKGLYGAGAY